MYPSIINIVKKWKIVWELWQISVKKAFRPVPDKKDGFSIPKNSAHFAETHKSTNAWKPILESLQFSSILNLNGNFWNFYLTPSWFHLWRTVSSAKYGNISLIIVKIRCWRIRLCNFKRRRAGTMVIQCWKTNCEKSCLLKLIN